MAKAIEYKDGLTVSMPVADLDRAIEWYQRVLGFKLEYRMDDIGWCEMVSPVANVNVGLSVTENPNPGGATPTLGVRDLSAAKASLEANDVRIDGDIMTIENMVSLLSFFDADENALMFFQLVADNE